MTKTRYDISSVYDRYYAHAPLYVTDGNNKKFKVDKTNEGGLVFIPFVGGDYVKSDK